MFIPLSLAISSFTDRMRNASIGVLLALVLTAAASGTLKANTDVPAEIALFNLLDLPFTLVTRIHTDVSPSEPDIGTPVLTAAYLGWTMLFVAIVVWRYRRLQVTR